jgi:hypothetical protein
MLSLSTFFRSRCDFKAITFFLCGEKIEVRNRQVFVFWIARKALDAHPDGLARSVRKGHANPNPSRRATVAEVNKLTGPSALSRRRHEIDHHTHALSSANVKRNAIYVRALPRALVARL